MKKIIVIGGGITGLLSAYYLVKAGFEVRIIDKGDLASGASVINAGYIAPSHIISLASPGVITKGLKWMWNSSSPFYIKPQLDLQFFDWAWKFKRSSTKEKVEKAIPVLKVLNIKSRDLYEEILDTVNFKAHYEKKGLLTVYKTALAEKEEIQKAERIKKEGLDLEILSREEILKLQPVLREDIRGAVYYTCDSHSTPGDFVSKLIQWLKEHGVTFCLNEEVNALEVKGDKITSVKTNRNVYIADKFVLAAGSWTSPILGSLGIKIPVQGGKGYSIDVYRETGITIPTILAESKVGVTPMMGFTRFAGTMEFSGNNGIIRKKRVNAIANAAQAYFNNIQITEQERGSARSGLRPVSPDGLPFIGYTSAYDNLIIATGHAMIGWSLGAVTGKLVSQLVSGEDPVLDLTPFSVGRTF